MDDNVPSSDFAAIFAGHNGIATTDSSDDAEKSWELLQASMTTNPEEPWENVDYNNLLRKTNQFLRRLSPTAAPRQTTKPATSTTTSTTTEPGGVITGENRQRQSTKPASTTTTSTTTTEPGGVITGENRQRQSTKPASTTTTSTTTTEPGRVITGENRQRQSTKPASTTTTSTTTTEPGRLISGENRQHAKMQDRYTPDEISAKLFALRDLPERPPTSPIIPAFVTSFLNRGQQQQTTATADPGPNMPADIRRARARSPSPALSEASTTSSDLRILNQTFWAFVVEYFISLFRRLFMGEHGHRE